MPWTEIIYTVSSALLFISLWKFITYRVSKSSYDVSSKRKRLVLLRNVILLCALATFFAIWSDEISTFALSMVAIAAATVVATKEFILSLLSSMFNVGQFGVRVGDIIQIGDKKGRVVDLSPMNIRMMEIDDDSIGYTGKELIFPSSVLATSRIDRQMIVNGFAMRIIKFQSTLADALTDEEMIVNVAYDVCRGFQDEAQISWREYTKQESLDGFGVKPKTSINIPSRTKPEDVIVDIYLRFAAPFNDVSKVEQEIVRRILKFKAIKNPA